MRRDQSTPRQLRRALAGCDPFAPGNFLDASLQRGTATVNRSRRIFPIVISSPAGAATETFATSVQIPGQYTIRELTITSQPAGVLTGQAHDLSLRIATSPAATLANWEGGQRLLAPFGGSDTLWIWNALSIGPINVPVDREEHWLICRWTSSPGNDINSTVIVWIDPVQDSKDPV